MDAVKSIGRVLLKMAFFVVGGYLIITVPDVQWAGNGMGDFVYLLGFAAAILIWIGIWSGAMGVSTWRHWTQRKSGQLLDFSLHLAVLLLVLAIPASLTGILLTGSSPEHAELSGFAILILLSALLCSAAMGAGIAILSGFLLKQLRS